MYMVYKTKNSCAEIQNIATQHVCSIIVSYVVRIQS